MSDAPRRAASSRIWSTMVRASAGDCDEFWAGRGADISAIVPQGGGTPGPIRDAGGKHEPRRHPPPIVLIVTPGTDISGAFIGAPARALFQRGGLSFVFCPSAVVTPSS